MYLSIFISSHLSLLITLSLFIYLFSLLLLIFIYSSGILFHIYLFVAKFYFVHPSKVCCYSNSHAVVKLFIFWTDVFVVRDNICALYC
jgi:hypothetical protein